MLNNRTMKVYCWKIILYLAVCLIVLGFFIAVWAINANQETLVYLGLIIIGTVCVGWWFWVMFLLRTMLAQEEKNKENFLDIQLSLKEIKNLLNK